MKKSVSISLMLLMTAAMLRISVATHYCGGKFAASTVSLTGKLANCGMDNSENELPFPGIILLEHCCDDILTFCEISDNYIPSFSFVPEPYQYNFQVLDQGVVLPVNTNADLAPLYRDAIPPGVLMSTNVDINSICVFRI